VLLDDLPHFPVARLLCGARPSVITAIGVGLGSMAQLHLDPFVASILGLVAGGVLREN